MVNYAFQSNVIMIKVGYSRVLDYPVAKLEIQVAESDPGGEVAPYPGGEVAYPGFSFCSEHEST